MLLNTKKFTGTSEDSNNVLPGTIWVIMTSHGRSEFIFGKL